LLPPPRLKDQPVPFFPLLRGFSLFSLRILVASFFPLFFLLGSGKRFEFFFSLFVDVDSLLGCVDSPLSLSPESVVALFRATEEGAFWVLFLPRHVDLLDRSLRSWWEVMRSLSPLGIDFLLFFFPSLGIRKAAF